MAAIFPQAFSVDGVRCLRSLPEQGGDSAHWKAGDLATGPGSKYSFQKSL